MASLSDTRAPDPGHDGRSELQEQQTNNAAFSAAAIAARLQWQ